MSKMHKWGDSSGGSTMTIATCVKCGMQKITTKQDRFVRSEYVDPDTGEAYLRAPECSEKLVPSSAILPDNQLKLDL